jgi:hypothetical protein
VIKVPKPIKQLPQIEQFGYKNIVGTINSYVNMNCNISNIWQSELHYEEDNTTFEVFLSNRKQFKLCGNNFEDISINISSQIPEYLK